MSAQRGLWSKILRKKSILMSLIFLALLFILSTLAYTIIPDNTPDANDQQLEIALKEPGFSTQFLELPKRSKAVRESGFFQTLVFGKQRKSDQIPFLDYSIDKDQVILTNHYGQEKYLSLSTLALSQKTIKDHIHTKTYLLGTDRYGRDILSRLILGIRISLMIGFMSVVLSLVIGITIGATGAYYGGWIDKIAMYMINITWSIPTLLLVFAIVMAFGRGLWIIFLAVGLTLWVDVARLVRGQVLKIKEEEFILATRSLSYSTPRIIRSHILPNIMGPLLVIAATNFAIAILIEAGLSYLGFGIQPPSPSVGNMLNENYGYAISGKPFLAIIPAITIMLMVLAFNLVGSGLRDILDVKSTS